MRKLCVSLITLSAMVLLFSACSASQPGLTASQEPAQEADSQQQAASNDKKAAFNPGTWMASSGEAGQYYFFYADGNAGCTANYENGTGVGFTYEQNEDKTVFHMGAKDVSQPCKVTVTDATHITLEWEAQPTESLTFVSALDSAHFHFYTNEELCALAKKSYESKNGLHESNLSVAASDNGDGTVTLQIYENLSDHNSTAAWYQIDRCRGEGKDMITEDSIDLTNGTPDIDITSFDTDASTLPQSYYECIVDHSSYRSNVLLSAEVPVTDFRVVSLEYTEGDSLRVVKELFSTSSLTPEKPLVLRMELPEMVPNIGIIYSDRNGKIKQYAISMSGLDGAPLLTEGSFSMP